MTINTITDFCVITGKISSGVADIYILTEFLKANKLFFKILPVLLLNKASLIKSVLHPLQRNGNFLILLTLDYFQDTILIFGM